MFLTILKPWQKDIDVNVKKDINVNIKKDGKAAKQTTIFLSLESYFMIIGVFLLLYFHQWIH